MATRHKAKGIQLWQNLYERHLFELFDQRIALKIGQSAYLGGNLSVLFDPTAVCERLEAFDTLRSRPAKKDRQGPNAAMPVSNATSTTTACAANANSGPQQGFRARTQSKKEPKRWAMRLPPTASEELT
ncbi:hypothetical protein ON010_g18251 [Phytophthora cinnamomi]|nr:hypothetical protein ON010_g18251 [Phytophthora cinnamomi]